MKIKVISSSTTSYASLRLVEEGAKRGHEIEVISPTDLYLVVSNVNGHDRVYNKGSRLYLSDIDAIIPRLGGERVFNYGLSVVEHLEKNMGIFSTADADGLRVASDKMLTHQKLSKAGVKVPKTVFAHKPKDYEFFINQVGGLPCVVKTVKGSLGVGVMICETPLATKTALQSLYKTDMELLFQEFIDTSGKDVRAIVIGGEFVTAFQRNANKGDFRANLAQGGFGENITLTDEQKQIAVDSANAVGLACAGVDLMIKDNETFVIEVNGNYNLEGVESVTGVNVALKMIQYVELKVLSTLIEKVENTTVNQVTNQSSNQNPAKAQKQTSTKPFELPSWAKASHNQVLVEKIKKDNPNSWRKKLANIFKQ
jgi:ribosomal protein S6--L-glutamate ligase